MDDEPVPTNNPNSVVTVPEPLVSKSTEKPKKSIFPLVLSISLVLVILIIIIYFLINSNSSNTIPKKQNQAVPNATEKNPGTLWLTYKSNTFPYSLSYPPDYVSETKRGTDSAELVIFKQTKPNQLIDSFSLNVKINPQLQNVLKESTATGINWILGSESSSTGQITSSNLPSVSVSTNHNGYIYIMTFLGINSINNPIAKQIQAAFKFTDVFSITPTVMLKNFTDSLTGYSISFPATWRLYQTHDPNKIKVNQMNILSGIELTYGSLSKLSANIVIQVFDLKKNADIREWLQNTENNLPENSTIEETNINGLTAQVFKYQDFPDRENEAIFLNKDKYVYKIVVMELGKISDDTRQIISSLKFL